MQVNVKSPHVGCGKVTTHTCKPSCCAVLIQQVFTRSYCQKPVSPLPDFTKCVKWGATLQVSPWQIPHSSKVSKGGEDTYYISSNVSSFGVFDGTV